MVALAEEPLEATAFDVAALDVLLEVLVTAAALEPEDSLATADPRVAAADALDEVDPVGAAVPHAARSPIMSSPTRSCRSRAFRGRLIDTTNWGRYRVDWRSTVVRRRSRRGALCRRYTRLRSYRTTPTGNNPWSCTVR